MYSSVKYMLKRLKHGKKNIEYEVISEFNFVPIYEKYRKFI